MAYRWATLPPAIISFILNHVARAAAASDHTLVRCAAVNKDWQYLFEQLTFRHLVIRPDDLSAFETIVSLNSDRRRWLRSVSFHDRADGGADLGDGSEKSLLEHNPSQGVCSLLRILKKWARDSNLRLALYLSARTISSLGRQRGTTFHQNAASLHSANTPRLPEKDGLSHIIEEIPAVKTFSIQYKGDEVNSIHTVLNLCSKLPGLEEFCLQDLDHRKEHTKHFKVAELTRELPTTLKRLHVLGRGCREPQTVCRFLVQRLVWFGTKTPLEELSITTSENAAEEFFEDVSNFIPGSSGRWILHWPALQSLTLTCSSLRPDSSHATINRLLHQAGMTALDLPGLRQLLLVSYNTGKIGEIDGLFRYVAGEEGKAIATCFSESAENLGEVHKST